MRIGITGQIGAGKSTAAKILQNFGAYLIDADQVGREVVERHAELRSKLARAFGNDVIDSLGNLKRDLVAQRAFVDETSKACLDKIVHPYLLKDLRAQLKVAERSHAIVLVDATLIFDWKLERELDITVVIYAPEKVRFARLARRGISVMDARARQRRQLSLAEYRKRADVVIDNSGNEAALQARLERFWANRIAKAIDR